jgi:hypothetical protein
MLAHKLKMPIENGANFQGMQSHFRKKIVVEFMSFKLVLEKSITDEI